MVVVDKRRSLIVSTAGHFFGVPLENDETIADEQTVLDNFLDRATCRLLCAEPAGLEDEEIRLKLSNELPVGRNTLVFFKLTEESVTEKNFHDLVHVTTTGSGRGLTLVEALRQVWAPTLRSSGLNSSYLKELEENLLGSSATTSVLEEEDYWRKIWEDAKRSHDKTIYAEAVKALRNIRSEVESAAVARDGLISVGDAVEAMSGYVDDLWKLGDLVYTEDRMKSFLDIIGDEVVSLVKNIIEENQTTDDREKIETILNGAEICEKWTEMAEKFTTLFWPHHSLHSWKGVGYVPERCLRIGEKLRQIGELRAQYRQLTRLLTPNERSGLGTDTLMRFFDDVRVVFNDNDKSVEWNRLTRRVEEGLVPAEERVAQKLKSQIADATSPNSLLAEFRRYFELMKRDGLKKALRSERETLLSAYGDLIENCLAGPDTGELLDTPRILQEVQTARSAELKLESLNKLGKELLADLPGYEEISSKVTSALKDIETKRQNFVDTWTEETKDAIAAKELTLGTDSAVVELTGTSMMRVTYDPRLMTLIREARALSSQGVELPREVRDLVERAGSLAGRARALQQVATFHNTIGDRMVPSQRPLMLTTALELARAVQEQSGVVWSDPQAVDVYTARLKELVRKFAQQNSELAAKHNALRDLVTNLLRGESVNMIGNQNAWKDALMNMRTIVDTVEVEYGNTKAWKLHWDRQLLKVLGVAYRGALPSLLKKLPEVKVELTFRDGSLQWRPSLEEVRAKLYSSIRRSLSIPMNFRGVGDAAEAHFGGLIQRSCYLFGGVYKQAEIALSALETLRTKWLYLAAPAKIDVAERLKGKSPQEWTRAFKDAKQWAQEVGRLRGSELKMWCISVDTAATRNDLESASRRYWERLCSDLRLEASSRLVAVVEFLSSASKELGRRPRNVEEFGLAYEAHARIQTQSSGMAEEMEAIAGLSKVLAAWTSEKLEGVSSAYAAWQDLTDRLERHKAVVDRELEDAKVNIRHRAVALRDEIERWQAKWSSKPEILTLDWIISMKERWIYLKEQLDVLKNNCQKIELNVDDILEDNDETMKRLDMQLEVEESNCQFQTEFLEELKNQEDEEWSVARRRLPRLHDWLDSWENRIRVQLKDRLKEQSVDQKDNLEVDTFVGKRVREVRATIEWLQLLRGDEIADEHWGELLPLLDVKGVKHVRDITLGHLFRSAKNIQENVEKIKEITKKAAAESGIRQGLMEVESWEASAHFQLQELRDSKNAVIILVEEYGSLLARAGELRLLLEGAKGAAGYERFAVRVVRCETGLSEVEERIKALSTIQRKWVYLEPVYDGGAAPNDTGRWSRANKEFRYLMGEVSCDPRVSSLRRLSLSTFMNLKDLLDRCQKSLDEYLEEKRSSYPRLYFLSDEDLLELVSASGRGLEAHLSKLYQGVGSIIKDDNGLTAVVSPEGEILQLSKQVDVRDSLPRWLNNLEEGMKNTLRQSLEECLIDATPNPSAYPTQVLLLSERIRFTERCETALKEGRSALKKLIEYLETQRARYRGLEDAGDKLTALKARGLLLDTVHHLEIARNLLNVMQQEESTVWTWQRQLRSYRTNKGPVVRCAGAEFPYRFEYQGAAVGLVQTPLTERCFLALTQAMKLGLGGSPTGPAGTGKTESVKALGAILGRLVLVFNCDEGMDAGSMLRILGGLAQAGAWGCFDEFNRLEEETLSAVAMLIRPLQEAVRDGSSQVLLSDQKVNLDPHCCVFITMNPAGSEYGGRRKLPDSLARLFRPIGMAHPDRSDIVKALLECAGFLNASTLAKQLVEMFDIAEILLSNQPHYDWGLRALRSVLDAIPTKTDLDETSRLVAAIRASTLPKLTEEDTPRFLSLLEDVFPRISPSLSTFIERQDLQNALLELCIDQELGKEMANRCIQLNDQLKSRTGVAIVGPPGCGKTIIRKLLCDALTKIGETIVQFHVFPGAMPKSRLLGRIDPQTREWKEGLLSNAVASAENSKTWIILNGDVEPEWAEALNSALDDNRLLTLPNGVGVKLGSGTKFIFETHKLAGASPATVSRLGVVHLGSTSPNSLLVSSRLNSLPEAAKELANSHLCSCIEECLKINADVSSASGLMNSTFCHLRSSHTCTSASYAIFTSLCSQIRNENARDELARLIYQLTDCWCPNPQKPCSVLYNEDTDRLEAIGDADESTDTDDGPVSLSGAMKKTLSSVLPWIKNNQSIMIRGSVGCGKSALISVILSLIRNVEPSTLIKGSSLYGPQDLVMKLKRGCVQLNSSSHVRVYKPRTGSRVILILEDLHLASKDLQELVRELIQEGGFHEEDLEFATVPLTIICTADATTRLHPRLEALLSTHYLPYPSSKDIVAILELQLRNSLKGDRVMIESWISQMAPAMLDAFRSIKSSHGSSVDWTPKDLVLWADSLKYYPSPENESNITDHLLDAGRRLFHTRLTSRDQSRWETIILSKTTKSMMPGSDVYIWKRGNNGLLPLDEEQWRKEIINAAARCAREGDPVQASISSHLLHTVAGLSWAFGTNLRGVILIGRPGAGRKSAVRLTAMFSSLRLIESGPGRGRMSVKTAVQAAGIDGEPTLLLLEEHHMREAGLAVLASAIVSRGELPGLFTVEELDGLIAPLADVARREDFSGMLEQYLYHRLRNYLRVAIILDSGELRSSWPSRSGLLRHCALIGPGFGSEWWSWEGALTEVACQQNDLEFENPENTLPGIKEMVKAHLQAPRQQQAPARFFALIHTWKYLHVTWNEEVEQKLSSLEAGVGKLKEAGEQVAKLEDEVSKQRQELEVEQGRANAALEQITATMRGATGQRGEMSNLKAETERESAELARRKTDIEGELGKVEPLVEQAAQAVAGISADALAEVRSLRAPPAPVRDVLEGVLRLMGIKDTSWNSMKTFLAKRGIKDEIRTWDARRSTSSSLEAVAKLVKERPESFEEKTAKRASVAAAPLAAWVLANLQYGQILQQVAPLEREQRQLAERLSAAEAQIGKLVAGLNTVESRVAQLQEELAKHSRGAAALQLRAEATEARLTTARALLQKLDTEHRDWQAQLEELTSRKLKLDIEAANVAALLVYEDLGKDDKWKKSAIDLLITERERLLWRAQGLPVDTGSLVGASCALRGPLVPIFIDPSGVAVSWLKSNVGSRMEVTKPEDTKFLTTLELAVRFGKPLLVEELVEFPSILLPLLRQRPLKLGERTLPAPQGFKLFLATRRDRLDGFPKEVDAVLFKIALGAGSKSLAERFVEKILLRETPGLATQRKEALEREEKLSGERDTARLDLLAQLATARGQDLLQESEGSQGGLLSSLEATQSKAKEIALALEESRRSFEDVTRRAKEHEKLAKFAASLYKTVRSLTALSPLYVFSSEAFTDIYLEAEDYRRSILSQDKREQDKLVEKRLIGLTLHYCSKAVYRRHRLPVALQLALSLNSVPDVERNFLLGETPLSDDEDSDYRVPDWVPEERHLPVRSLVSSFPQIGAKMKPSWLNDVSNIYAESNLTTFQKVLLIKTLRPDYLHTALSKFAAEVLGVKELAPPHLSLRKIAEHESTYPVLLLLSPGADPGSELRALANNQVASATGFVEVSLGQGQVAQAELALENACRNGNWILLSNLHLALNWLPRLESLLRSPMCTNNKNPVTRIWLTTEECLGLYPSLAGLCLKLAYEPPEGVKRNVKRSLQQLHQKHQNAINIPGSLLLSWLHATLQERRKFVPQGWIRSYEWNESDLEAAYELVVKEMTSKRSKDKDGNWQTGRGLLDVAIYGGRLQDDYDMRALCSIVRDIWSAEVFEGRRKLANVLRVVEGSFEDTTQSLERVPDNDLPKEYFGLPANAHRAWERTAAEAVLSHLKGVLIRVSDNNDKSRKKTETKIQRDLKELIDRHSLMFTSSATVEQSGNKNPLESFFIDEMNLTKKTLNLIRIDVEALRLENNKIPAHWVENWKHGPKEVLPFVKGLLSRYQTLESILSISSTVVDMSRLARPRAFLTVLKQHTARETHQPMENLRLCVNWFENRRNNDWKISLIIEGLLISGALIEGGILTDLDANAASVVTAPSCQIAYLPEDYTEDMVLDKTTKDCLGGNDSKDILNIPVYATSQRDVLICSLPVGCPRDEHDNWLRRGIAFHLKVT
ncbi:PREDICTED: cytoplasmic dynein 2 heavy chain 1 [Eufriesea mexicana]|uniref:cytoplasmic dynein 2 heavy chain 1 n=1 Tax=Eufriesea mexicana TaxID=516756 RepID=UPI00083C1502|nr:PREDICTED: cytoplasmic dynein 2 heavy chain 1 [Eufriesea mexicana]